MTVTLATNSFRLLTAVTLAVLVTCSIASNVPVIRPWAIRERPQSTLNNVSQTHMGEPYDDVKEALTLIGQRGSVRTILFVDGYAYDQQIYYLKLPPGEHVQATKTSSNNSDILTSSSASFISHPTHMYTIENITLTNQFEGTVGVVTFTLEVQTNLNRTFNASGTYFVTGLVGTQGSPKNRSLVTGVSAPSVTFENPDDVIESLLDGDVEIYLDYQPPGPDVYGQTGLDSQPPTTTSPMDRTPPNQPPSNTFEMDPLDAALSGTGVQVQGDTLGSSSQLVQWDPLKCHTLSFAKLIKPGSHYISNPFCGIAYDPVLRKLLIRLRPGESGRATVVLTLPTVPGSAESLETTIRVYVKPPPPGPPELLLESDANIRFDFYGNEVFTLLLNKTRIPFQPENASDYILDLPDGRYARADLSKSDLNSTRQVVTFITVPMELEDPAIVGKLRGNLIPEEIPELDATPTMYMDSDSHISKRVMQGPKGSKRVAKLRTIWDGPMIAKQDNGTNLMDEILESPNPSDEELESVPERHYFSGVHVVFPSKTNYVTAKNVGNRKLQTGIAPEDLALLSTRVNEGSKSYVEVVMQLYGYAEHNFSEHKSQQIAGTIGKMVRNYTEDGESVELIKKQERFQSLLVTFRVFVEHDAREAARSCLLDERGFSTAVAREAMLPIKEVEVYDSRAMVGKGDPNYSGAGGSATTGLSGATVGIIVVASVVLTLVLAVPIAAIFFAHMATRSQVLDEIA